MTPFLLTVREITSLYPAVTESSGRLAKSPVFPTVCHIILLIPSAISSQQNTLALTQNTFSVSESLPYPNPSCVSLCTKHTALSVILKYRVLPSIPTCLSFIFILLYYTTVSSAWSNLTI